MIGYRRSPLTLAVQFVRGLSSLLDIAGTPRRKLATVKPEDALRGDMERIGADMYRVIGREKPSYEKASRKATRASKRRAQRT